METSLCNTIHVCVGEDLTVTDCCFDIKPFSLLKRHIFLFLCFLYFSFVFPNVFSLFFVFFLFLLFSFVFFLVGPVFAFETDKNFCFYPSCILSLFFPMFSSCFSFFFSFSCFSLLFSSLLVPFSLLKRHIFLFLSFLYFVFVFPNVF